jgi:peptide/nickel transport system substrate-binding protein
MTEVVMVRIDSRRRGRSAVAILATAMFVAGPFAAPAQAQPTGGKTLRVALVTGIDHLNPFTASLSASTQMGRMIYEFLTLPSDKDSLPTGGIAEKWEPSPDKLTWTFTIRQGMKWSDGQPVTAKDAAFTFNKMLTDETARTANGSYVANFASVEAPDDRTLIIKNKVPQANMASLDVPIVPEHIWKDIKDLNDPKTDDLSVVGVGDGPFILTEYKPNEYLKFKANPDYWRGKAKIDSLQYLVFKDAEAAVNGLRQNEVDIINRLTPTQFDTLQGQPGITTNKAPGRRYTEMMINFGATTNKNEPIGDGNPILKDIRVRQAIAKSIDTQAIVDRVMGGYAQPGGSVIPPVFSAFHFDPTDAQKNKFDPAAANTLLDQAGYTKGADGIRVAPDGKRLEFRLAGHASRDYDQRTTEYVTGWLKAVGIAIKPELVSDNELDERTTAGNYDLAFSGWGTNPDPDYALSLQACDSRPNAGGSGGSSADFFCDPEFDSLYKAQQAEFDQAKRVDLVKKAQSRLYDMIPTVVLDYDNALEAYRSENFSSFGKQPQPNGVILEQTGYWGVYEATPAGQDQAAGAASDSSGNTGLWIGIGVVVIVIIGGVVFFARRGKTADDRE